MIRLSPARKVPHASSGAEGVPVEAAVGVQLAHCDADADLGHSVVAVWDEHHAIAVRVGQRHGFGQTTSGDDELAVAAVWRCGQRRGVVVDLQHAAGDVVSVLVLAAMDG